MHLIFIWFDLFGQWSLKKKCFWDLLTLKHRSENRCLVPTFMYLHSNFSGFNKYFPKKFWLLFTFILCNFINFLSIKTSKVAHNRPRPFFPTVQPRLQPTAQNWFSISWNLGTRHLFSYLWFLPWLLKWVSHPF